MGRVVGFVGMICPWAASGTAGTMNCEASVRSCVYDTTAGCGTRELSHRWRRMHP
jgi:hypothetical protein